MLIFLCRDGRFFLTHKRNIRGLIEHRGKRPKLNHRAVSIKMANATKATLEDIAAQYGCLRGGEPWIGGLLARIAEGDLVVFPAPPKPIKELEVDNQGMSQEERAWLDADLSRLAEHEPYDWGETDPLTVGQNVRYDEKLGWVAE
jgi:hypothetical protein